VRLERRVELNQRNTTPNGAQQLDCIMSRRTRLMTIHGRWSLRYRLAPARGGINLQESVVAFRAFNATCKAGKNYRKEVSEIHLINSLFPFQFSGHRAWRNKKGQAFAGDYSPQRIDPINLSLILRKDSRCRMNAHKLRVLS